VVAEEAVSVMSEGVPLGELHCPTCGERFRNFNLHSDRQESFALQDALEAFAQPEPWYILCPNGHKWTIKTLWRSVNKPDRVQLDRFLGMA
jgi:hypothetical protein